MPRTEGWGTRNLKSLLVNVLLFHKKRSKWFTLSLINSVSCNVHLLSSQEPLSRRTSIPKCYFLSITINTLLHECSPVNFLHIFRTSFLFRRAPLDGCLYRFYSFKTATVSNYPFRVNFTRQVLLDWKSFKNDEKCFLFRLKSSFHFQDI